MRAAILDLGTNTFHLLIADISGGIIEILYKESSFVKIGEKGISDGLIIEAAQGRALSTLQRFRQKADEFAVEKSFATATSAIRSAKNGSELLLKINEMTGFYPQTISGQQEAEWIYEGVISEVPIPTGETALLMDIGGGSIEFIIADSKGILWRESFEIGAQRLYDQFFLSDPIHSKDIERLENFAFEQLRPLWEAQKKHAPTYLIGSAGTFDTLRDMDIKEKGTEQKAGYQLSLNTYQHLHQQLLISDRKQRMGIPGMIEERVDMIVVASALLNYIMTIMKLHFIKVSDASLKEGVLQQIRKGKIELRSLH